MEKTTKRLLLTGAGLLAAFALWTVLVQTVDVRPCGQNGTAIGFAAFNLWFHRMTGVHMALYAVTDWLGLVPVFVCLCFGAVGLSQWIGRKRLLRVDVDLILLGFYYSVVIFCYLIFEMIPINYRPIPINGVMEASYPSSTTLLVLSVMPTLPYRLGRRCAKSAVRTAAAVFAALFSAFMVTGRLLSGVHWATDIIGSVLLSAGVFLLYCGCVRLAEQAKEHRTGRGSDGVS